MTEKGRRDFCIECRKEAEYLLRKKNIVKSIRDKDYTFEITVAVCTDCGEEMSIPGLIDKNIHLPKDRIMNYYILINQKYGIDTENGLRTYICDMLNKSSSFTAADIYS